MKLILRTICLSAFIVLPLLAHAQTWTKDMEDGSIIRIDPDTNKATRFSDQGKIQLWDGTHRMQDGSVVIIQDGVVTSGAGSTPGSKIPVTPGEGLDKPASACIDLVVKVCGFNGECSNAQACSPARQLMKLEADEAWQSRDQGANQTAIECRKALLDEAFFSPCSHRKPDTAVPTACERLVSRVCGSDNQCTSDPGCSPARQLLNMELEERMANRNPKRLTYSAKRCNEAMENHDFFKSCTPAESPVSVEGEQPEDPAALPLAPPRINTQPVQPLPATPDRETGLKD